MKQVRRKAILKQEYGQVDQSVSNNFTIVPPNNLQSKYLGDNQVLLKIFNEDVQRNKEEGLDHDGRVLIPFKLQENDLEYDVLFGLEISNKENFNNNLGLKGLVYGGFGISVLGSNKRFQIEKAKRIKIQIFESVVRLSIGNDQQTINIDSSGIKLAKITMLGPDLVIF